VGGVLSCCISRMPEMVTTASTGIQAQIGATAPSVVGPPAHLSSRLRSRMTQFSQSQPRLSPRSYQAPRYPTASIPQDQPFMPRRHTLCWGGSALREGSSKRMLAARPGEIGAIAADTYLLSKRQRADSLLLVLAKTVAIPLHAFPLEGLHHANQARQLAKEVLRELGADIARLRKIDLSAMTLEHLAQRTPLRHGMDLRASVLPCNTARTRHHLLSVLPSARHGRLNEVLNDRTNYIEFTIGLTRAGSVEGSTLSEAGWHQVLALVIAPDRVANEPAPALPELDGMGDPFSADAILRRLRVQG